MSIVAITENHTEKDLVALFPGADLGWILLKNVPAPGDYPQAEAYLDLDFANEPLRREQLNRLLPALVIVNAVTPTLREIGQPFVRLNAWPGFAGRKVHEIVAPDEPIGRAITEWYARTGCSCRLVPDTPGMIAPRILAAIINEAWYTWEEQVSTREAIDTAMKLGTNYPMGPFEWGGLIGLDRITELLWALSRTHPRYTPARSLQQAAGEIIHSGIKM